MKAKIFTLIAIAAIALSTQNANAKVRRVGYFGTAVPGVDYTTLQTAHDSSNTGDTLLIFPGSWSANYSKKLVTIGYGYFVTGTGSNANLQNITGSLSISIVLNAKSDSCTFTGLDGFSLDENTGVAISNINVNRCNINAIYFEDKTYNNWQITQCFTSGAYTLYSASSTSKPTNLLVRDCYINYILLQTLNSQTGIFSNDVFGATYTPIFGNGAFTLVNDIFLTSRSGDANCVYTYCIASSSYPLPTGTGNQSLAATPFGKLFNGYPTQGTYSNDGAYTLKTGSAAIGAGSGGVDCGMFGGANPYRLSGIPAIPAFYQLTAPSNTTSGNPYTITFSVQSNN